MRIVFDLDGVLANTDHRHHYLDQAKPDWVSFTKACVDDDPEPVPFELLKTLAPHHHIEIWSGRIAGSTNSIMDATINWLTTHSPDLTFQPTSPAKFFADPTTIKVRLRPFDVLYTGPNLLHQWIVNAIKAKAKPDLAFEDRSNHVETWRRFNIPCYQTDPGDF